MGDRYITLVYLSILTALLISEVTCKVGDNCTMNDVTTCGDPAGAGYQCDGNDMCQCTTDYYEDATQICTPKLGHNIECPESTQCNDNLGLICIDDGTGTNTNKCLCNTAQYYDSTQCVNKGGYGEGCSTTVDSCSVVNGGCYTVDIVSTCSCNSNYYTDNNQCKSVDELKPTGITTGALTSSTVTISWIVPQNDAVISFNIKGTGPDIETSVTDNSTRTYTVTGLTPNTQYTAVTVETVVKTDRDPSLVVTSDSPLLTFKTSQAGYREQCVGTATDQCSVPDTECKDLNDGNGSKCYCQVGFYTNINQCLNADDLKPTYTGADPKTTSVTVRWALPANSQFISSFTIEVNGTKKNENIGNTATSSEITNLQPDTIYNIVIITIVNTDSNSNYEVKSGPQSIITKQKFDGSCTTNDSQCTGNLTCIGGKCGCGSEQYLYNDNCYPKLEYDGDCSNSNVSCKGDFTTCYNDGSVSRCKCESKRYWNGNECKLVSELKPTSFEVTDSTSTSLTFSWNILSDTYISSYVISGDNFLDKYITNTARTGTITGLSPGTDYTNIKITAKVKTGRGNTIDDAVSNTTITDNTNPGIPGQLDSNNVYNSTIDMMIRFDNPTGGVDKYIVTITGPGLDNPLTGESSTNNITVPANTLLPGRTYTISIIAVYKEKNSTEFTSTIKTQTGGSGPVSNLAITDIYSRNLTVSWSYPEIDSGPLTAYILDVKKKGNECVQRFVYVSDIDNKPTTDTCEGILQTDIITNLKAGVRQEIIDLLPYTNYTLTVTPYNENGPGSEISKTKPTEIEAARDPSNLKVTDIKATSFSVTWNKPDLKTGPTTYYLKVYEQENLANNQTTQLFKTFTVPDFDTEQYDVNDVVSYWYYKVELQASTVVGNSSVLNVQEFQTLSSAPGKVSSLIVRQIDGDFRLAEASWDCLNERERHGVIMNYTLTSTLENESPEVIQPQQNCEFRKNVTVKPGEKITFELYATNMNFKGESFSHTYQAPIGKPILPKEEDKILLPKTGGSVGQTSFSVTICASCLRDDTNGPIKITAILVCVKDKCDINDNELTVDDIKKFSNWKTAKAASFNSPYRVTNDTWLDGKNEVTIVIGEESESFCEKQADGYFCNGPLNMDTEYQIIAVSCTDGGCTYSQQLGSFKTKAEDTDIVTPVVVSIVVILIVIAVIIGAMYLYKRRKSHQHVDEHSIHSIDSITTKPTIPRYRPIKLEHFEEQLANLQKDSNLLFSEEFEGIGELSPKHESIAAQKDENKPKNRYVNILSFDHSRVKLLPIDDDETTDYINANYIPGYKSQREYIASQGPLVTNVGGVDITTIPDFWRMIWEQRVAIIVMLSDLTEKGKPKVDKYWKDQGESEQYGDIVVEVTSVSVLNKYTIKIFELKLGEEVRKVRHFFLPGWEDYRANLQPEDVLEFLSVVRQEVKPIDKGPMVVHCSAGVGRTGTFIALDIFQQFINDRDMATEIDIYDLVLRMRNFRQNMVQSEKQYIFIHETIKEIISQRRKRLQDNDTAIYENTGYSNEAFVPDDIYQNVENGKPTTTL